MATARPQLRGLLGTTLKRQVVIAGVIGLLAVVATKVLVKDARLKKYEEFYKHYDADKDFERMKNAGVFRSVKPGSK